MLWLALATVASVMLLATTHRICQDLAVVPLLWIAPLALYLLSFILCFDHSWWYKRWLFAPLFAVSAYFVVSLMHWADFVRIGNQIIAYLIALFAVCMLCHGELVRLKPSARFLTRFYLVVASGGALGGVLVAVVAPLVLNDYWEYHLGLIAACVLIMFCVYRDRKGKPRPASTRVVVATRVAWGVTTVVVIVLAVGLVGTVRKDLRRYSEMSRNFYGVVRIEDRAGIRKMMNGRINHGTQFIGRAKRRVATSYYGRESGIGIALSEIRRRCQPESGASIGFQQSDAGASNRRTGLRIGVVGLGTGTMAALTEPGDTIRFYEINPEVYRLTGRYFTYLDDTRADVEVVFGDARVALEREAQNGELQQFDVLAVDAFTSDAVPLHLLTREALELYFAHLVPNGLLAVHVSNRYANLAAVVRGLAGDSGRYAVRIYTPSSRQTSTSFSRWVMVTRDRSFVASELVQATATPWTGQETLPIVWTDNDASLWQAVAANLYHSDGRWKAAPNQGNFVLDPAGLLSYGDYLRLLEVCRVLYHKTGGSRAMMVVTANKKVKLDGRALSFDEFSQLLYEKYELKIPGKTEGIMLLMSVAHSNAAVRLPTNWPVELREQIRQQFAAAIKDGTSGNNLSEHLVPAIEAIDRLVRQTVR